MEDNKDKLESDFMYKSCTTRSDRDAYRICPSKLTKRELEDLYFTLLEDNVEQKKTIDRQQDRIKMLTTKVQRMFSAQKVHQADERKDSYVISKCMVNQHKQSILELKRTNERMAERIRQLNAQLTSARQISKNRPFCVPKFLRVSPATSPCLTDDMSNRSVEIQADLASSSQVCDENKCRTLMNELKQKIVNLEEELARAHFEYSNRMSRLEIEVSQCRNQDILVRQESVLIEPGLQQPVASVRADNELAELKNQLVIEKNKVAVLETQLKIALISNLVPKINENQLPSTQEQHPEENKEWDSFWDCTCTPVCPHYKPVCTMLRLFNRGLFCSPKNTNSKEIEIPNRRNDSTPRDANVRQDLAVDNTHTDEPLVSKYKVLPEVEHKDLSGFSKREFRPKDNEYEDKPEVEYNLPSDSRQTNAFISKEYKKKLNTESKETSGDNNHLDEFHSNKDKNNPSVKIESLPNKNKNETPRSGNKYKTLSGIEYKDLSDEKLHLNMLNVQNYEDMAKVIREEKPDVNRPKYEDTTQNIPDVDIGQVLISGMTSQDQPLCTQPKSLLYTDNTPVQTTSKEVPKDSNTRKVKNVPEIKDDRSQSQPYTKTGPDLIDNNKSLNLSKDQNITEGRIKNDLAPQTNTQAWKGPSRSQNTDDKSQLIDSTSKLTDNVSQRIDERNQCIDIKSRRTDDKKQPIDDKSQGQRTDDTSQRTDDKSEISKTSQTWLDGGDSDIHNIFTNPKIADTNEQKVQTNNNVTANMPVTDCSQPQSERNYFINCYHKCGCHNAIKVRDTFISNANKNFVGTMTADDRSTLNLPNSNISQGLTDTNKTLNEPTNNNRPDLTCTNEVRNQTKPYIKKDRGQTQPGANIIPNLIETNESRGQTEADMTLKIPTLNSQNQTDFNKDKAQTQFTTKKSTNPSDTNERQDVTEEDMTRNIRTRPNLSYAKEVKNQTKSNIGKDKNLSQPGAIISSNLPDINESQGLTEVDNNMTPNTPTFQTSSNIKKNRAQTKLGTKSPNLTDTKAEQGPTDTIRNIRTHSKNLDLPPPNEVQNQINSNIKKIKAQSQPGTNKSPNLTDTHQTQAQTDMIRHNKNQEIPSANGVQQRIDSNPPNYIHQSVTDKNKSPDKVHTNMSQNLPKLNKSNKKQNNSNQNISNASRLQDQTVIYMKKDIDQVESDISQELSKADKILVNARLDQEQVDSNMKKDIDTQPKDNKKIGKVVPYSKEPSTLVENLTDICGEQLETIAELERQLDATKEPPRYGDKINLNLGKYYNTDEDDINEMAFSKESISSKHELTTTKVADQNKTGDDLTSKWPQDNPRESKQKQESSTKSSTNRTKTVTPKNDRHNSLQIPGPIPLTPRVQTNNWKTNVVRRFSKDGKKRSSKENNKKTKEASSNTGNEVDKEKELSRTSTENEGTDFYVPERDNTVIETSQTTKKETKFVPKKIGSRHDGLSSPVKAMASNNNNLDPGALMVKCMELSMTQMIESVEKDVQVEPETELIATQKSDTNGDVPVPTQRELKTYRSKDGTLCFETKPILDRSRCCQCNRLLHCEDYNIKGTQPEDKTQLTSSLKQGTSTAAHSEGTQCMAFQQVGYLIPASKNMPAETPKTPPQSPASPPKNQDTSTKTASTSTNVPVTKTTKALEVLPASATTPIKIPAASSENKPTETKSVSTSTSVPANTTVVKKMQVLPTDVVPNSNNNDIAKEGICTTTTTTKAQSMQLMQEKLEALAAELARYKEMLLSPPTSSVTKDQDDRRLKKDTKSVLSELDEEERQLTLKRGVAMHTIDETYAPRCVFKLHVGTIVLSDEAVRSTRDRSLVLMWTFYNHNASITRMDAGRVMLFDSSSEYNIQITDEFLEYMKHEEMIIAICDSNDQNEPFATCALPLREALLHTNRRADMSLELVAGPLMIHARSVYHAEDDLDPGDEVGVIDLWCMLRADAKMLPIINKAIARPSKSSPRKKALEPRVMQPLIDSDSDSEDSVVNEVEPTHSLGKSEQSFQAMRDLHNKNLHRWGSSILRLPSGEYNASHGENKESQGGEEFYKNKTRTRVQKARDSVVSSKSNARKKSKSTSQPEKKSEQQQPKTSADLASLASQVSYSSLAPRYNANQYQRRLTKDMNQGQGGILINEVIANIKTPQDMKIAMENTRNSPHHVSRLARKDDDIVSQAHSGGSSFRRNSDKNGSKTEANASSSKNHEGDQGFQKALVPSLVSDTISIYKKYDNISKQYNSKSDLKKQVTIKANNINDNNMQDEPQRDEPDDDSLKEEQTVDITILWLALNEECEAMCDPRVQKVYVAYSFLGKSGADLETPFSLPKPKNHVDKCYFNFKKTFQVEEEDIKLLGHMARRRAASRIATDFKDCIVFSVISEPSEDPLGLDTCEDIGYAFLYLGDLLAYSAGSSGYTEVIPVRSRGGSSVCGVLAVRVDGLDVLRCCAERTANEYMPSIE